MTEVVQAPSTTSSALSRHGLGTVLYELIETIKTLYLADSVPWVVGYSGGKDSTATLQLVWMALSEIAPLERTKPVHVISTDTLVENPVVASWVIQSLKTMERAAQVQWLPIKPHRLTPEVDDSFWVNLIGKGYPAPRHKFRWCTERLKIKPSNKFVLNMVRESGECILVLGTRKAESAARAKRMKALEEQRIRDVLVPNMSLPNSLVYAPISDWSNDDVWQFLIDFENPWGGDNHELFHMYRGATADNECPLVVDTSTPSCGDSRFGCWVCTLVEKDRSMTAMIQNDDEKHWMTPLLQFRDKLDVKDDHHQRDFRRMAGYVQLYSAKRTTKTTSEDGTSRITEYVDSPIPGPYVQPTREMLLRELLKAQRWIQENGPPNVADIELVTLEELQAIRRIWVIDKHEFEDSVRRIYEEVLETPYPGSPIQDDQVFNLEDMVLLREACDGDELHFELVRELLDVEARYRTLARRAGLFDMLEKAFRRSAFEDIEEATARARRKRDALSAAREGDRSALTNLLGLRDSANAFAGVREV